MPPPQVQQSTDSSMWIWIVVALFVFSLIGVGIWYFLIRKEPQPEVLEPPLTPPPPARAPAPRAPAPPVPAPITGFSPTLAPAPGPSDSTGGRTPGPAQPPTGPTFTLTVSVQGGGYRFTGSDRAGILDGTVSNPILYFAPEDTVTFDFSGISNTHPFHVKTVQGNGTADSKGKSRSGFVTWTAILPRPPSDSFFYNCEYHQSMTNKIIVSASTPANAPRIAPSPPAGGPRPAEPPTGGPRPAEPPTGGPRPATGQPDPARAPGPAEPPTGGPRPATGQPDPARAPGPATGQPDPARAPGPATGQPGPAFPITLDNVQNLDTTIITINYNSSVAYNRITAQILANSLNSNFADFADTFILNSVAIGRNSFTARSIIPWRSGYINSKVQFFNGFTPISDVLTF